MTIIDCRIVPASPSPTVFAGNSGHLRECVHQMHIEIIHRPLPVPARILWDIERPLIQG